MHIVDRERGEVTHRLMARDLDISPLAAEIIFQALRPVVHEYVDIEASRVSVTAIEGVDQNSKPVAETNFRESTCTANERFGGEDIDDWESHAVDDNDHE